MDLQIKLVNDGHAARHESAHAPQLPRWAIWKHEAYGTTCEPVGLAYHRQLLSPADMPRTHAALAALLQSATARFQGRVATYDIERSGLGFLIAANDARVSPHAWELVRALGDCRASLHADTQSMLDAVASGQALIAYNVLGIGAEAFARSHPDAHIGMAPRASPTTNAATSRRPASTPSCSAIWAAC